MVERIKSSVLPVNQFLEQSASPRVEASDWNWNCHWLEQFGVSRSAEDLRVFLGLFKNKFFGTPIKKKNMVVLKIVIEEWILIFEGK